MGKFQIKKIDENPTEEELLDILDAFHNMLDSFENKNKQIEVASCLANIMWINYEYLNVKEYKKLEKYIKKFKAIMKEKSNSDLPVYNEIMKVINIIENNNK